MKYDFDPNVAKIAGVEEAILLSNIDWWCAKNRADRSEMHFKDGFYWTYSSERAWADLFPFWTAKQISRMTDKLEKTGLIVTERFGGNDRTKWYRPSWIPISPNGPMQKPKRAVPSDQTGQCIKEQIVTTDSVDTDVSTFVEKPKGKKDESKTKKFLDSIEAYVENDVSKMGPGTDSEHFRECCQKVSDSMQVPIEIVLRELPKFADYWTQKDENGRKQHWEKQKTFDLVKRLRTWFGNNSRFNSWSSKKWSVGMA